MKYAGITTPFGKNNTLRWKDLSILGLQARCLPDPGTELQPLAFKHLQISSSLLLLWTVMSLPFPGSSGITSLRLFLWVLFPEISGTRAQTSCPGTKTIIYVRNSLPAFIPIHCVGKIWATETTGWLSREGGVWPHLHYMRKMQSHRWNPDCIPFSEGARKMGPTFSPEPKFETQTWLSVRFSSLSNKSRRC